MPALYWLSAVADSDAERKRRQRARQRGELPPPEPLLCACGNGRSGRYGLLCRDCWRQSPEGKIWQRQRIAAYRDRKRA